MMPGLTPTKKVLRFKINGDLLNFVEDEKAAEEVLKLIDDKLAEIRQGSPVA